PGLPGRRTAGPRAVPAGRGALLLVVGPLPDPRLLQPGTAAVAGPRAVHVPGPDPAAAALAPAVLLRLAGPLPRAPVALDDPGLPAGAGGPAGHRVGPAPPPAAVRPRRAAVLRRPLRHQQRDRAGTGVRASQPF